MHETMSNYRINQEHESWGGLDGASAGRLEMTYRSRQIRLSNHVEGIELGPRLLRLADDHPPTYTLPPLTEHKLIDF